VKRQSSFQFCTDFCRLDEHFYDCRWAPPQVRFFLRNSDVRIDRRRLLPFGRSVTPINLIFSSSRSTLVKAQFFPKKLCQQTSFSWRRILISARSSLVIFLIHNTTIKKFVTFYVYCHSLDGATLFSMIDSNKLQGYVKNTIVLICVKFGANLVNTSKDTSRKTKWPLFVATLYLALRQTNFDKFMHRRK